MITLSDIRITVLAYVPYDTGYMFANGVRFSENEHYWHIQYDGTAVPYITYQEEGFTHYLSGKRVEVNKDFIKEDTVNALNFLVFQSNSEEESLIMAANKRTVQARVNILSQGAMEKLTPERNGGGKDVYVG